MRRSVSLSWRILHDVDRKFKALSRTVKKKNCSIQKSEDSWALTLVQIYETSTRSMRKLRGPQTDRPDTITRVLQRGMGQNSSDMSWESGKKGPEPTNKMASSTGGYVACAWSFNPFELWQETSATCHFKIHPNPSLTSTELVRSTECDVFFVIWSVFVCQLKVSGPKLKVPFKISTLSFKIFVSLNSD